MLGGDSAEPAVVCKASGGPTGPSARRLHEVRSLRDSLPRKANSACGWQPLPVTFLRHRRIPGKRVSGYWTRRCGTCLGRESVFASPPIHLSYRGWTRESRIRLR